MSGASLQRRSTEGQREGDEEGGEEGVDGRRRAECKLLHLDTVFAVKLQSTSHSMSWFEKKKIKKCFSKS